MTPKEIINLIYHLKYIIQFDVFKYEGYYTKIGIIHYRLKYFNW